MAAGSFHVAREIQMTKNWIGPAREKMEKKGTVGSLHKALGVPEGKKIPLAKMETAKKDRPGLRKKIQFAENVRK
jgi:hypothetical protein